MFELKYFRGRVALSKLLLGVGVKKDDNVALQAFTCTAVPEAIFSVGARPIYIDLECGEVNMSPVKLDQMLKKNTNIKVVIVQHTFGIPAQIDKIIVVAEKHNIPVIEDCAHTFMSSLNGKQVGKWGVASFYSFEWGKPIIAGFGGALSTESTVLTEYLYQDYKKLIEPGFFINIKSTLQIIAFKILYRPSVYWLLKDLFHFFSNYGFVVGNYSKIENQNDNDNDNVISGDFMMKIPRVNRLWLNYSIPRLEKSIKKRKNISDYYIKTFSEKSLFSSLLPVIPKTANIYYARFPLIVRNKKYLLQSARKSRIEISGWYDTPVHPLKGLQLLKAGYIKGSCPNAEKLCSSLISLPVNEKVTNKTIDQYAALLGEMCLE